MKQSILALLAAWLAAYRMEPFYTAMLGVSAGLVAAAAMARGMAARIQARSHLDGRPVLVLAAAIVAGVCMLWAATDAVLAWRGQAIVSERLLRLLMPAELSAGQGMTVLRTLLGLPPEGALRLPPAISMPLGLVAATAANLAIAAMLGSALAELVALQSRPDDVLRRERQRAARAQQEAQQKAEQEAQQEAGAGPAAEPDGADASTAPAAQEAADASADAAGVGPLPDDGLGRLYKLLGHWNDLLYVEPRFLRWYQPLTQSLRGLVLVGVLPCALGYMPVPAWVGAAILAVALRIPARSRPPERDTPAEAPADESPEVALAPAPAFVDDPEIAPWLAPVAAAPGRKAAARRVPGRESQPERGAASPANPVLGEILGVLGVSALYAHQARAARAFAGRRSVLLCTPPGSGRALVTDALVLQTVLIDAERVLYLAPDAARARSARARFDARAEASHWKWNVPVAALSEPSEAAAAPGDGQPALVFADPLAVHRELCRHQDRWHPFLSGLGVVVLVDLHEHDGARAAHLAHLLRRLYGAVHRARAATAGDRLLVEGASSGLDIRVLATAEPGIAGVTGFAQRITGCAFERIGPEHDAAPRPAQSTHVVLSGGADGPGRGALGAIQLRDAARARGLRAELEGYDTVLSAAERDPGGPLARAEVEVIVARLSAERGDSLSGQLGRLCHLGAPGVHAAAVPAAVLWQPDPDPLAGRMARALLDPAGEAAPGVGLPAGPRLVVCPESTRIERDHLLCTLAEGEISMEALEQAFSLDRLHAQLAALRAQGRLMTREQRLLDPGQGNVRTLRSVRLAWDDDVHDRMDLSVCSEPWHLVERTTGEVVCSIEGGRGLTAAYPRRVMIAGGRRVIVLEQHVQEQGARRRVLCEPCEDAVVSVPVRCFDIALVERRGMHTAPGAGPHGPGTQSAPGTAPEAAGPRAPGSAERRGSNLRSIGGEVFSLQHRDADIHERVLGVRRYDLGGRALDSTAYDEAVQSRFHGRVAVLGFPAHAITPETLHGLVHAFRICLPALVRHGEDDLDVVALPDDNAIAFVDLHPGGAGFADALTLEVVGRLLRAAHSLVRDCPAACASACPECLHIWSCRAPAEQYQRVDRAGAAALLRALLERRPD